MGAGTTQVFIPYPEGTLLEGDIVRTISVSRAGITAGIEEVTLSSRSTIVSYRISGVTDTAGFNLLLKRNGGWEHPRNQSYRAVSGGVEGIAEYNPTTKGVSSLEFLIPEIHYAKDGRNNILTDGWSLTVPVEPLSR